MSIEIIDKTHAKLIVSVGGRANRKRRTKIVEYSGKRDLDRQYQDFRREVEDYNDGKVTIEELVSSYIKNKETLGAEPTTIRGYNIELKRIISAFPRTLATECNTYHIERFIAEMENNGFAPKTIKNTISLLSASFNRGVKTGMLSANPCKMATLPKNKKKEIKTLEEEAVYKLVVALQDGLLDYKVGYELCLFCGLRRSEVLGLTPEDINLEFKTLTINKSRHRVGRVDTIQPTKTERSHRTLALPDFLCREIKELISMHNSYDYEIDEFLILDAFGRKRNPSTFTNYLSRIERKCGVTEVSVHGLRHTYATMLNASGVDIARISQELGHSNISTTMNVYTHVFGNASASSRGIAEEIDKMWHFGDTSEKEKACNH